MSIFLLSTFKIQPCLIYWWN